MFKVYEIEFPYPGREFMARVDVVEVATKDGRLADFGAEVAGESKRNEMITTKPRRPLLDPMRTHQGSHAYASWPWAARLFGRTDTYAYAYEVSMRAHWGISASINRGAFHHFKGAHFHI
ncbi:hypothetical protein PIB30_082977 [Stylosanthes scabra]|uniref:Uncharacterized protein n=1 Tax=Stylosanthes scabra TaxID=79078 RepID=A0ABU6XSP3_9FABA|nr:hypothetical protein [Stylosanthes scabra]